MSEVSPVRVAGDAAFLEIVSDSRGDVRGKCFVCMPEASVDTHKFLSEVALKGAVAAIVYNDEGFDKAVDLGMTAVQFDPDLISFNHSLGLVCRELYSDPSLDMRIIGITGTNGKTTCAWMLRQALRGLGREAAYLGTLGYQGAGELEELPNTTPFPADLWALIHRARLEGISDLVMEVSSHALHQNRVAGVRFNIGVFTNLSQDHLDYHKTIEEYAEAKKLLFTAAYDDPFVAVINADDLVGSYWLSEWEQSSIAPGYVSYGFERGTLRGEVLAVEFDQLAIKVNEQEVLVGVGGSFNASNALTVFATLHSIGVEPKDAAEAMRSVTAVPGRFEAVASDSGVGVIVDYAHTPDALDKLLSSAKELDHKKLICVFGCGGDRDATKRPQMAEIATRLADRTVLTSDNPRTEDPAKILQDIERGVTAGSDFVVVPDRREAIAQAIAEAESGDLVVIAGKGHETYQIIGRTKTDFDDRQVAREALAKRGVPK
ncbi:MAG: UDP-N-acetylmuramoyl-L-alanyl-D-glutamate--2,6-diaminopimelate ligase [Chthonomonas sp.]|nr:UDP-N-acetylmuramoyl-L-alanyl-D-glutamate--2,6-diaminopimelate ligase [Chthonomonas sp.]